MKYCESTLHTLASYLGSPHVLDFAFTMDISDVSEARVHSDIQSTDHAPISIKVNGLNVVSWNLEGLCKKSIRVTEVKQNLKELIDLMSRLTRIFIPRTLFTRRFSRQTSRTN